MQKPQAQKQRKPRSIINKLLKTSDKKKILKAVRKYRGTKVRITAYFSMKTTM